MKRIVILAASSLSLLCCGGCAQPRVAPHSPFAAEIDGCWGEIGSESYWIKEEKQWRMNIKSGEWAAWLDARTYLVYARLVASLDAKDSSALIAEQERWLRRRANLAKSEASEFEGGTMWPMQYHASEGYYAAKRLLELERRLRKLEKTSKPVAAAGIHPGLEWFPSIFIITSDEDFWESEIKAGDRSRTWRQWEKLQRLKLEVAYAFLQLRLPPSDWQQIADEALCRWREDDDDTIGQGGNAEAKHRAIGRAAAGCYLQLQKQFKVLVEP